MIVIPSEFLRSDILPFFFSESPKHWSPMEYYVSVWQVSSQLMCNSTRRISTWFGEYKTSVYKNEKLANRALVFATTAQLFSSQHALCGHVKMFVKWQIESIKDKRNLYMYNMPWSQSIKTSIKKWVWLCVNILVMIFWHWNICHFMFHMN